MESDNVQPASEPAPTSKLEPILLEYAPLQPPISAERVFAAVCSVPAAIGTVFFLVAGVSYLVDTVTEDRWEYLQKSGACFTAAFILVWAAIRWGREGFFGDPPTRKRR